MVTTKLTTEKGKSYWQDNGAYSDLLNEKWKELVPVSGNADTLHGELIRCFARLNYEFNNNGNCNCIEHRSETCYECGGGGFQDVYCSNCDSGKIYNDDDDDFEDCSECNGSGFIQEDCSECCGDGSIDGEISIDDYYQDMIDFLSFNLPNSDCVDNLTQFILDKSKGYSKYKFNEEEMAVYNAVGDAVGHFVINHPNKNLINQ
jgi:RecJ-like exonuclease